MRLWVCKCVCQRKYCTVCASVCLWPNSVSLRRSFGAYRDSFAFSQLSHFFCGFRSEQLLNGHSSSETGHWEAQKGLARVSALPNRRRHTHTHTLRHTPGKAWLSYGSESEMWPFSRCFPPQKWLWRLFTLLNLTTMENKACHTCIIADNKREILRSVWQKTWCF